MSKYIDADRLKELLDAKYKEFTEKAKKDCPLQYQYMADGLDIAEQFIDSLQQEQPEVELEEAAAAIILKKHPIMKDAFTMEMAFYEMLELVKAGYELGLNARKEEQK